MGYEKKVHFRRRKRGNSVAVSSPGVGLLPVQGQGSARAGFPLPIPAGLDPGAGAALSRRPLAGSAGWPLLPSGSKDTNEMRNSFSATEAGPQQSEKVSINCQVFRFFRTCQFCLPCGQQPDEH